MPCPFRPCPAPFTPAAYQRPPRPETRASQRYPHPVSTKHNILVVGPHPDDDPHRSLEILNSLTDHLGKIRREFPQVEFGLTGMPVLEWDESLASQLDMQRATYFSLAGVAIVFVIGFGSWRLPLCAIVCLAISPSWTVGLAALVLGHLNLFSIAFGAILAGLGIEYVIHVLT